MRTLKKKGKGEAQLGAMPMGCPRCIIRVESRWKLARRGVHREGGGSKAESQEKTVKRRRPNGGIFFERGGGGINQQIRRSGKKKKNAKREPGSATVPIEKDQRKKEPL